MAMHGLAWVGTQGNVFKCIGNLFIIRGISLNLKYLKLFKYKVIHFNLSLNKISVEWHGYAWISILEGVLYFSRHLKESL